MPHSANLILHLPSAPAPSPQLRCGSAKAAAPMNSIDDVIADEHLNATGFIVTEDHPSEGRLRTTRAATSWSHAPAAPQCGAPRLGEHGAEILRAAGYRDDEIHALEAAGVTALPA